MYQLLIYKINLKRMKLTDFWWDCTPFENAPDWYSRQNLDFNGIQIRDPDIDAESLEN